tara:strand:+ start:792 stop:965 length:174 start_codon:yes stop_codon:yes gene_type:complete
MKIKEKDLIVIGIKQFIVEEVCEDGYWVADDDGEEAYIYPDQIDAHFPSDERITDEY